MAQIYQNAVCVIAAAAGRDSHSGCFSERDPLICAKCRIGGNVYVTSLHQDGEAVVLHTNEETENSRLGHRGWVFQERLLARRTLIFGRRGIFWECFSGQASELDPEGVGVLRDPAGNITSVFKIFGSNSLLNTRTGPTDETFTDQISFRFLLESTTPTNAIQLQLFRKHWTHIVWKYSLCDLTKAEDKLIALSGLAQRVRERTGFQYLAGLWLPNVLFDLMWYTATYSEGTRSPEYRAPTWSWAVMDGPVTFSSHAFSQDVYTPLVSSISTDIVCHPSDHNMVGQVFHAVLGLIGRLGTVRVTFHPITVPRLQLVLFEELGETFSALDIHVEEGSFIHLLPLSYTDSAIGRNSRGLPLRGFSVQCLVLSQSAGSDWFERVGMAELWFVSRMGFDTWLDGLSEEQEISIR
ncbi:hypothetical protein W97_02437 [Coniosporium apollinis CBS 100218]|uniref:Heterokaryon incompatibility domain-containing protein n=1 Tax=Coniosporium apollinis (strain CBS 100218) TaxID=1168221 RepID=R7YMQ4_CONA1|nr:uncharacterized protein W97_02437 [Coniosporium apollinis CBS 100218]EON63210.1 hypothetical protein W97_02437 [Coniosporium apollinis CBS 100218]